MPVERHEQDGGQRDVIGWLRARVADGEEERARMAAAAMAENSQLRAEVAMLRAQLSDLVTMLGGQDRAAEQATASARAEGWRAGYEQRAVEEGAGPPRRGQGERHLRIVSFSGAALAGGRALLRHKVALAVTAAAVITAATLPSWHTAEFRVGVPGGSPGPSVVAQAFAPQQGRPSPPPGHGGSPPGHPSPGSSHGHGHGHGHGSPPPPTPGQSEQASPSPSPDATTTDPGTPTPTDTATTDPSGSPAPACTPG